jgi:hypothetical protein
VTFKLREPSFITTRTFLDRPSALATTLEHSRQLLVAMDNDEFPGALELDMKVVA